MSLTCVRNVCCYPFTYAHRISLVHLVILSQAVRMLVFELGGKGPQWAGGTEHASQTYKKTVHSVSQGDPWPCIWSTARGTTPAAAHLSAGAANVAQRPSSRQETGPGLVPLSRSCAIHGSRRHRTAPPCSLFGTGPELLETNGITRTIETITAALGMIA